MKRLKPFVFYIIFFLFILAYSTTATNYDYDFWARLIAGMSVVQTGHVLKHDIFSYTPTHIWYDHEWGSGVIFYLSQHFFGTAGILFLQAILVFAIFFVISKIVNLRGVKTTSAYNFLFYYFALMSIGDVLNMPIRCQLFSFLFFAIFIYILESARLGKQKMLWFLPFLMLIWNNLHGGCVAGIGLILLYILGEILNRKPIKQYFYALIGTLVVLPINPWSFEYLKFLFMANTMQRTEIVEWFGLFSKIFMFKYMKFKIFALILLSTEFGVITKCLKDKTFDFDKTKFIVLAVTLFFAIKHVKLLPLAVISMSCFLYEDFYSAFNAVTKNFFNKIAFAKDIIIYILILAFVASNLNAKAFQPLVDYLRYPVVATEFIKINNIKGNLMAGFGYGSYLSYKLYPNNKIFMDGRYEEVYNNDLLPMLKKFNLVRPGWDDVLKKYPPDVLIIEKFYPVYYALQKKKEYKLIYEDSFFTVFVRSDMPLKAYVKPTTDINYYKQTLFDTDIKF